MIQMKRVHKTYNGNIILDDLSLAIKAGEFVFLNGESGSGKSTLLKLLYRDILPDKGEIWINGQTTNMTPRYLTRRQVGTIFQSYELLDRKTILENVSLAGEIIGRKEIEIKSEAAKLIEKVGLKGKENYFPDQLSGGEQQRVAIARALLNRPKVLLADEPTGNLDDNNSIKMMELLKDLNTLEGITMLIVTHSMELTQMFSKRTILMKEGKVKDL